MEHWTWATELGTWPVAGVTAGALAPGVTKFGVPTIVGEEDGTGTVTGVDRGAGEALGAGAARGAVVGGVTGAARGVVTGATGAVGDARTKGFWFP